MLLQSLKIRSVPALVRQLNIQSRARFEKRIVFRAVHRESEDRLVAFKNGRCPVALMNVTVNDGGAFNQAIALDGANRNRHVVQNAKAFAPVRESVMRAASKVRARAIQKGP